MIGIDPDETKYECFTEDQPDPQSTMKTENDNVKVEEDDVLEQYFSKKSKKFSSWTRLSSQVSKEKMTEENDNQHLVWHFTIFLEFSALKWQISAC